jgi:hypothetical protein
MLGRVWPTLLYATLCGVLMLALRGRAWQHVAAINEEEWQPIQTFIRPQRRGEEPICFLPSWTVGHATDQYKFRGIDLIRSPEDAWEGRDQPEPGFWVVSQFGAFDPSRVPAQVYPHRTHVEVSGADVYVFRREPFELEDSLALHIREAACVLDGPGAARLTLVWDRIGFSVPRDFPGRSQLGYLGCRAAEGRFGGRSHHGIWMHPPPPGQSLSITWSRVRVDSWLVVGGGLTDQVAGRKAAPIKLSVVLDSRDLGTVDFTSQRGWKTFAIPTGEQPEAVRFARLSMKVWTTNNHSRHLVIDGQMSRARPAGTRAPGDASSPDTGRDAGPDLAGDPGERGDVEIDAGSGVGELHDTSAQRGRGR